jgi:hypothetical protein
MARQTFQPAATPTPAKPSQPKRSEEYLVIPTANNFFWRGEIKVDVPRVTSLQECRNSARRVYFSPFGSRQKKARALGRESRSISPFPNDGGLSDSQTC